MKLIGLSGFKKSGKDTTHTLLNTTFIGHKVVRRAFADKLKIAAAYALGFDREPQELIALMDECKDYWLINILRSHEPITDDWTALAAGVGPAWHSLTGREYLQHFGNRMREVFGDTFWIDQVLPNPNQPGWVAGLSHRFDGAEWGVVTDARYPNEAERILELGGEVWEIVRPGLTSDGHVSETPLPAPLVTLTISNDSDIPTLQEKVADAAYNFGQGRR